jgi:hypothetical protein
MSLDETSEVEKHELCSNSDICEKCGWLVVR